MLHIQFVNGSYKHIQSYYDFDDENIPVKRNIETDDGDDEEYEENVVYNEPHSEQKKETEDDEVKE